MCLRRNEPGNEVETNAKWIDGSGSEDVSCQVRKWTNGRMDECRVLESWSFGKRGASPTYHATAGRQPMPRVAASFAPLCCASLDATQTTNSRNPPPPL